MSDLLYPLATKLSEEIIVKPITIHPTPSHGTTTTSTPKEKKRCSECNRTLKLVDEFVCKCGKILCAKHKFSDLHKCNFDHKATWKQKIRQHNPTIESNKIEKI